MVGRIYKSKFKLQSQYAVDSLVAVFPPANDGPVLLKRLKHGKHHYLKDKDWTDWCEEAGLDENSVSARVALLLVSRTLVTNWGSLRPLGQVPSLQPSGAPV